MQDGNTHQDDDAVSTTTSRDLIDAQTDDQLTALLTGVDRLSPLMTELLLAGLINEGAVEQAERVRRVLSRPVETAAPPLPSALPEAVSALGGDAVTAIEIDDAQARHAMTETAPDPAASAAGSQQPQRAQSTRLIALASLAVPLAAEIPTTTIARPIATSIPTVSTSASSQSPTITEKQKTARPRSRTTAATTSIRLTDQERVAINRAAARSGMKRAGWIRRAAVAAASGRGLDPAVLRQALIDLAEARADLNRIGNLFKMHGYGGTTPSEMAAALSAIVQAAQKIAGDPGK